MADRHAMDHHHHHYHHRHGHQHGHASLYTGRRPHLQFPPPPPYPPPEAAGGVLIPGMPAVPQAPPSNASAHPRRLPPPMHHNDCPYSYSYAYYEPGAMALADRQARHTYVTRYGTEENIYEEIGEVSAKRQAALEEEVRCVQSRHRRVLGELNLTVEAMLMPQPEAPPAPDLLEDLLRSVGPTDELLSPQTDTIHRRAPPPPPAAPPPTPSPSGQAVVAVQINHRQHRSLDLGSNGKPLAPTPIGTGSRDGFWSRKNWRKIPGFHASSGKLNDEPRMRSGSWDDGRHHVANRTVSSEDSYCSASDRELSSDEESDKGTRSNGHLSATLSKAKKLCENFRTATTSSAASTASSPGEAPASTSANHIQQGRLLRWFSIRRNSNYEVETGTPLTGNSPGSTGTMDRSSDRSSDRKMPLLPELEEDGGLAGVNCVFPRRQVPPSLPPPPANLTAQQLKRRHIVAAIVHSENSYVATLQRLVNDFKKPLEESQPPILSSQKIQTLFHRLPEILQCHTLFRIALAESVRSWDKEERLGDVFVASFSKAIVLDIYSGFINNFSVAMELAKQEAKRKSALADFFKVQQISSHDRLSFFGLMVKPVQRFPQFILFLQDLLKHTPQGHPDRMSLQLALTQLESLAEMLNERKREAEQFQAFKEMLRLVSGKFSARPLTASDRSRCLLREDNVQQLEFNGQGLISKSKARRLLLLNDLLVCVAVSPSQRLSLKWNCPVTDIEVVDNSTSPTLSRLLTAGQSKGSSLKSTGSSGENSASGQGAENLCAEMGDLMHDFEVVSRIQELAATLKGNYQELSVDVTRGILSGIQSQIQQRDEEMAWLDSCCLQLKKRDELLTFQMESPAAKQDWITELRLAQLALDSNNSPAWEVPEQERRPSTKMPLFVHARPVQRLNSGNHSEVRCGCYYTVSASKTSLRSVRGPARRSGRSRTSSYLWVCTTDGSNSHIAIMTVGVGRELGLRDAGLRDVASIKLLETNVTAMEFVRGNVSTNSNPDTVWVGTDNHKLILYTATEAESPEEVGSVAVPAGVCHIRGHCDNVFVALSSGSVLMMRRVVGNSAGGVAGWAISDPQEVSLGVDPVACLLAINLCLYAACGNKVFVLSALTGEIQKSFVVAHGGGSVNLIAHSGIGLWISLVGSSTICLYHTETFKHLQDINIASNVVRVTTGAGCSACDGCVRNDCANNNSRLNTSNLSNGGGGSGGAVSVTALLAGRGLLWVGTNVGIALTIPLPRLEGVPIISGRVNISFHAHFGPITFLLALQPRPVRSTWHQSHPSEVDDEDQAIEALPASPLTKEDVETNESLAEPTEADTTEERRRKDAARLRHQLTSSSSPVVLRRRPNKQASSEVAYRRASKTLPRGLGMFSTSTTSSQGSGDTCDVYGLYGELMYVKDYEGEETVADPAYESLRRSDPELAAIPGKVSTLDRQLRLKASRPRSLDLSNWSVDSRTSSLYTSSGSEGSRPVSRQNSAAGDAAAPSGTVSINASPSSSTVVEPPGKPAKAKGKERSVEGSRRTVITIMGGRGYVNWRQSCCPSSNDRRRSSNATAVNKEPNSNDAHLVVWEMKL